MITKTDSIESSFLQIPGKRNAGSSNMSKHEQSIFRTNDWVVGSAKTLKKTMQTSSKKEYELLLDDEIGQSSKKSIAADSDRSNADLRLRQENILLR